MSIGFPEVAVILVIILIIFGAGKLPQVMGDMAKGVKSFKKGLEETASDGDEPKKAKKTVAAKKAPAKKKSAAVKKKPAAAAKKAPVKKKAPAKPAKKAPASSSEGTDAS